MKKVVRQLQSMKCITIEHVLNIVPYIYYASTENLPCLDLIVKYFSETDFYSICKTALTPKLDVLYCVILWYSNATRTLLFDQLSLTLEV